MRRLAILAILTFAAPLAMAEDGLAPDFSRVSCPGDRELARELIELQVAGVRVPGRKDACVAQSRFPHVLALPPPVGEAVEGLGVKYVSETKPFEIRSIRRDGKGRLEIGFVYNVVTDGKVTPVEDILIARRYDGYGKKYFGCGAALVWPQHQVIKRSCHTP